jgi:hypothetical protein
MLMAPSGDPPLDIDADLRPEGKQILVGDFPSNIALHPDGKHAAVLHCGYGKHEVVILDLAQAAVRSRVASLAALLLPPLDGIQPRSAVASRRRCPPSRARARTTAPA